MKNKFIHVFRNVSAVRPSVSKTVEEVLTSIRTGKGNPDVSKLRALDKDDPRYGELKKKMPCVMWNATLKGKRSLANVEAMTGLMYLDIDADVPKETILSSIGTHVLALWRSCGGRGWSLLVPYDPKTVKDLRAIRSTLSEGNAIPFDNVCDATRLNIVSYDPDIYVNWDAEPVVPKRAIDTVSFATRGTGTATPSSYHSWVMKRRASGENVSFERGNRYNFTNAAAGFFNRCGVALQDAIDKFSAYHVNDPDGSNARRYAEKQFPVIYSTYAENHGALDTSYRNVDVLIDAPFIDDSLFVGHVGIRSATGTGKTTAIAALKDANVITPRRALKPSYPNAKNATVINSILKYSVQEFKQRPLVIDEANTMVRALLLEETMNDNRREIIQGLKARASVASDVILLDAYLDDDTVHFFEELLGVAFQTIENAHKNRSAEATVTVSKSSDSALASCVDAVKANDAPFKSIAVTTVKQAQVLAETLPNAIVLTGDTVNDKHVQRFLQNPVEYIKTHDTKAFIYTSAGHTGVDISGIPGEIFALDTAEVSFRIDQVQQAISRLRHDGRVHVFTVARSGAPMTVREFYDTQKQRFIQENGITKRSTLAQVDEMFANLETDIAMKYRAVLTSASAREQTKGRTALLCDGLKDMGLSVRIVEGDGDKATIDANNELKNKLTERDIQRLLEVPTASRALLEKTEGRTSEEQLSVERYFAEQKFGRALTEEDATIYVKEPKVLRAISYREWVLNPSFAAKVDEQEEGRYVFDKTLASSIAKFGRDVVEPIAKAGATPQTIDAAFEALTKHADTIKALFGFKLTPNTKPASYVKQVLELYGYDAMVKRVRVNGKREYLYTIFLSDVVEGAVQRRAALREQKNAPKQMTVFEQRLLDRAQQYGERVSHFVRSVFSGGGAMAMA